MQQWCKPDFCVEYIVIAQLLKQILGNEAQLPFRLHKLESFWGSLQEINQIFTLRRGNKPVAILSETHLRLQP
jgi:hypothetical protein